MSNAKRVLELGMYTDYSALACAEALPDDDEIITCEFDPYLENHAKEYTSKSVHAPARDTINKLTNEQQRFDIIFLDANSNQYCEYYQVIMDRDSWAPRGTIVVDNAFRHGNVYCETGHMNGEVLVPIRDGVRLIRRKEDMFPKQPAD